MAGRSVVKRLGSRRPSLRERRTTSGQDAAGVQASSRRRRGECLFTTRVQANGLAALLLFAIVVTKDAWVSDDAFITLRTIDNFWNGYGLRWNAIERVQTYTHPAWMLLLGAVYGVTREPHLTMLAVSLAVTGVVAWQLIRRLTPAGGAFALMALAGSRAFVDYSTSGLENPLSHLLVATFWLIVLDEAPASRRRLLTLATLTTLAMLSRLDLVLLTAPGVILEILRSRRVLRAREMMTILALASVPLVLWHLFTLIYYGFPFPNTAYAKLGSGLSSFTLMAQGLRYLRESCRHDPLTLLSIAAAVLVALWRRTRRQRRSPSRLSRISGSWSAPAVISWPGVS